VAVGYHPRRGGHHDSREERSPTPEPSGTHVFIRVLTDKRCIHLRSASIWTYTFFTMGFPRFLSIRGARGLQAFDLLLLTNYSTPIYG
jgi:hypothetical protein